MLADSTMPLSFWVPFFSFFAAIWPADVLGLLLHETGHAIAARSVGYTVLCWGVGNRKVLLRVPVGGAIFYFGWPMSKGLMLAAQKSLEPAWAPELVVIAGGIIANAAGLAAGIAAWAFGWHSAILLAWIVVSAALCARNAFPHKVHVAGTSIKTDGRKILDLVFRTDSPSEAHLGVQLQHMRAILQFLERVRHPGGIARFSARTAILEAALGNLDQARKDLECAGAATGLPMSAEILALARLTVASIANEEQTPQLAEQMRLAFGSDRAVQFQIDCSLAAWRHARGMPTSDLFDSIKRQAAIASRPAWIRAADVLGFTADPTDTPDTPDIRCRQIMELHPAMLGVSKISLLTTAASRLAALGQIESAREFRGQAADEIRSEASYIDSPETRATFVSGAAARLQAVLPDDPFTVEIPQKAPTATVALPSKGKILAWLTFAVGAANLLLSIAVGIWDAILPLEKTPALIYIGVLCISFIFAALTAIASLFRGERRMGTVLFGLLLGFSSFGVLAILNRPSKRHVPHKAAAHGVLQDRQARPLADGPAWAIPLPASIQTAARHSRLADPAAAKRSKTSWR
ncbi:MAG TPA: hypothetical protein VGG30_02370 [Pirellulales bacterium]|jgi:hypothetical protein